MQVRHSRNSASSDSWKSVQEVRADSDSNVLQSSSAPAASKTGSLVNLKRSGSLAGINEFMGILRGKGCSQKP